MRHRNISCLLIICTAFLTLCAAKVDERSRNIYALFTRVNPKLSGASAKKYAEIIIEAAEKYKLNPYVIAAIIVHESTVNNKAVSKGGDYGLMQVRWKVHEKAVKQRFPSVKNSKGMFDARVNIFFGTEIFYDCVKKSGGDVGKGLLRYSAGNKNLRDKVLSTVRELESKNAKKKGK
ncbi:MAG: transglycosylase SLT domain-containing protein [Synergistaceae bacterium]|nr:transglycosylase SLT domain-containing protein [Synergistaceae bacterium]